MAVVKVRHNDGVSRVRADIRLSDMVMMTMMIMITVMDNFY